MLNKFKGCLIGLAIGDAMGMPSEGLTKEQIKSIYGTIDNYKNPENHFKGYLKAGQYTDDTQQTLALAEAITKEGFSKELFIKNLIEWYKNEPRGIGPTSEKAIKNLINDKFEGIDSKTCGAAMRVAPLALYCNNLDELKRNIIEASKITHNNDEAIAGALAVGFFIFNALKDRKEGLINECSEFISDICPKFSEKIRLINNIEDIEEGFEIFGTGINAIECVPSAILCFLRTDNFKDAIIKAVNAGGDTDSLGCMVGAMAGAYYNYSNIPKEWIGNLENRDYIISLTEKLWHLSLLK
ncbi:ADP-ribosylglycohydrolase family protein [Methanotorris formicicus]|uniref:ADP-ribosylation/Crystallin J1 n=1 Tax=Methanotorris formicicus Mc-S-70 TaxID=647171 RepID=H1L003_9EURY|nr:ADP-ribosylglycohydrolase family protein [Methanotorris formicicus]EHP85301.1 ADP-ribosylation/Crystallin J1 [Methanotorris formicicus Mc-S-70]